MSETDDSNPQSHAHDQMPATVTERIEFIAEMMQRFEWERGKSAKVLAARWGVSKSTIENYSAEASRRVTADAAEVRREITVRGVSLLERAHQNGDARDFAAVGKLLADVSGANAPSQHQIVTTEASPQEAARLVRQAFGEKALGKQDDGDDSGQADSESASPVPDGPTAT